MHRSCVRAAAAWLRAPRWRARLGRGATRRLSAGVPGCRSDARARRRAGRRRRRRERAVARVAREDPAVRSGHWFERARRRPAGMRQCGPPAHARCSCGAVAFCSRDCQRTGFDAHAAACTAAGRRQRHRRRFGRRGRARRALEAARAAVRAAEAAVAGEEAGPAPDDRADGQGLRARYRVPGTTTAPPTTRGLRRRRPGRRRGRRRFAVPPRTTKAA